MVVQAFSRWAGYLNFTAESLLDQVKGDVGAKAAATLIAFGGKERVK